MKVEEIQIALKKNQEVKIALNIVSDLKNDLGRGDSLIVEGRKRLSDVVDGYQKAITVYNAIIPLADRYIDMAKALGESTIQKQLEDTKKEANEMIKTANNAITKLKSI